MKKLVAIFHDDAVVDLNSIAKDAIKVFLYPVSDTDGEDKPSNQHQVTTVTPPAASAVPPRDQPQAEKPKARKKRIVGRTTLSTIMEHFTPSGTFRADQARTWLQALGYSRTSATPALSSLVKDGLIRRLGNDRFQFVRQSNKLGLALSGSQPNQSNTAIRAV